MITQVHKHWSFLTGHNEVLLVLWQIQCQDNGRIQTLCKKWEEGLLVSSHRWSPAPFVFQQEMFIFGLQGMDQGPTEEKMVHLSIQGGWRKPRRIPLHQGDMGGPQGTGVTGTEPEAPEDSHESTIGACCMHCPDDQ